SQGENHQGPIFLGRYRMEILDNKELLIQAQLRMMPQDKKDFVFSSLLCMSRLKAQQIFSRYPLIQSLQADSRENAADRQRAYEILSFIQQNEEDLENAPDNLSRMITKRRQA